MTTLPHHFLNSVLISYPFHGKHSNEHIFPNHCTRLGFMRMHIMHHWILVHMPLVHSVHAKKSTRHAWMKSRPPPPVHYHHHTIIHRHTALSEICKPLASQSYLLSPCLATGNEWQTFQKQWMGHSTWGLWMEIWLFPPSTLIAGVDKPRCKHRDIPDIPLRAATTLTRSVKGGTLCNMALL